MAATTPSSFKRATTRSGVYVLQLCKEGCYYVGASSDVHARIDSHVRCPSVRWVLDCGGVKSTMIPLTPRETSLGSWEMHETIARMLVHGFNSVRGWEYSSPRPLGNSDIDGLFKLICGGLSQSLCHSCGLPGHCSPACRSTSRAPWMVSLEACREQVPTGNDVLLSLIQAGVAPAAPIHSLMQPPPPPPPPRSFKRKRSGLTPREAPKDPEALVFVSLEEAEALSRGSVSTKFTAKYPTEGCTRCGRPCHTKENCYARKAANGGIL